MDRDRIIHDVALLWLQSYIAKVNPSPHELAKRYLEISVYVNEGLNKPD